MYLPTCLASTLSMLSATKEYSGVQHIGTCPVAGYRRVPCLLLLSL